MCEKVGKITYKFTINVNVHKSGKGYIRYTCITFSLFFCISFVLCFIASLITFIFNSKRGEASQGVGEPSENLPME